MSNQGFSKGNINSGVWSCAFNDPAKAYELAPEELPQRKSHVSHQRSAPRRPPSPNCRVRPRSFGERSKKARRESRRLRCSQQKLFAAQRSPSENLSEWLRYLETYLSPSFKLCSKKLACRESQSVRSLHFADTKDSCRPPTVSNLRIQRAPELPNSFFLPPLYKSRWSLCYDFCVDNSRGAGVRPQTPLRDSRHSSQRH